MTFGVSSTTDPEDEQFTLADEYYCLVRAITELTAELRKGRLQNG